MACSLKSLTARSKPALLYDPNKHHPLLIPTSGDSYPGWTLEHFQKVVNQARPGKIVVLQFHGVPDPSHPWVNTPPALFREEMSYLKSQGFQVIALAGRRPISAEDSTGRSIADIPAVEPAGTAAPSAR